MRVEGQRRRSRSRCGRTQLSAELVPPEQTRTLPEGEGREALRFGQGAASRGGRAGRGRGKKRRRCARRHSAGAREGGALFAAAGARHHCVCRLPSAASDAGRRCSAEISRAADAGGQGQPGLRVWLAQGQQGEQGDVEGSGGEGEGGQARQAFEDGGGRIRFQSGGEALFEQRLPRAISQSLHFPGGAPRSRRAKVSKPFCSQA